MDVNFVTPLRLKYLPGKRQTLKFQVYLCDGTSSDGPLDTFELYSDHECSLKDVMTAPGKILIDPMFGPGDPPAITKGKITV
jgi:hypothetical protein